MIYRTKLESASVLPYADFVEIRPGRMISRLPLIDGAMSADGVPLFARLSYADALLVAQHFGGELPDAGDMEALRPKGFHVEPWTCSDRRRHHTLELYREHDAAVFAALAGWNGWQPVCGAGKHWLAGAPEGRAYLMGWYTDKLERYGPRRGPGWVQPQSVGQGPHNADHYDYATTTMIVLSDPDVDPMSTKRGKRA